MSLMYLRSTTTITKKAIADNASQKLTLQQEPKSLVLILHLVSLGQTTFLLVTMSFIISNNDIFDEGTGNTITGESAEMMIVSGSQNREPI